MRYWNNQYVVESLSIRVNLKMVDT